MNPLYAYMSHPFARLAVLIALATSPTGCRDNVSPSTNDITVMPRPEGLEIVNTTDEPIYSMAVDEGTLALIYFAFCSPRCPVQLPTERRVLPWTSVLGYSEDRFNYVVFWAHATVAADGTVELGPVHTRHVTR